MDTARIYDLFRRSPDEGRSSYLHDHYRRGLLGVQEPPRSRTAAHAAWQAGRDTTAAAAQPEPPGAAMPKSPECWPDYEKAGGRTPSIGPIRDSFWAGYKGQKGVRMGVPGSVQRRAYQAGVARKKSEPTLTVP